VAIAARRTSRSVPPVWPQRCWPFGLIAASTGTHRLLPSRRWRRTAGPRPKQILGYHVTSVPPTEAGMPGCDRDWSGSWGARTVPLMALRAPTKVEPRRPLSSCAQEGRRGSKGREGNSSRGRQLGLALLVPALGACACADAGPSGSNHAPPAAGLCSRQVDLRVRRGVPLLAQS